MKVEKDVAGLISVGLDGSEAITSCPFCGCASVELNNTWTALYWISCMDCGAEIHGDYGPELLDVRGEGADFNEACHMASAEDALERWNTRVGGR